MKIALGSDHHGIDAVAGLVDHLHAAGHETTVLGPRETEGCDYPDAAFPVAAAVADGDADRGILVCGSGIGMCIAANKVAGVRAGLAYDAEAAEMMRRHNDANVLCLAAARTSLDAMVPIVDAFLASPFDAGRHARRVDKIVRMEQGREHV